ncbi:hypothetical protein BD410DRAFT_381634 [Rickenella mellea]|uniref:F-box domain-containing protein n=1 Tax=Rickenella mellea TaxID=50990 RepID=A0A4Y7PXI9_9AGAM|nr:hypothetical protein BD410DRAFT_381634 [Rickenella mellea]
MTPLRALPRDFTLLALNAITSEFFYERISIQNKKQLIALTEGLKSPIIANRVAQWTRRFDLNYAHTPVYNNGDKGMVVRILRSCPNLTHLVIEVDTDEYKVGAKARDTTTIIDACAKSCKRLEVLHLAFNLTTYMWAEMPLGVFLNAFRNIRILRLGGSASMAIPRTAGVHLGELPFLHTFEACKKVHFVHFTHVRLPLLSALHIRRNRCPYIVDLSSGLLEFISVHGKKLTTLTFIGVVHEHNARGVAPILTKCMRLQVFVTDIVDLIRLLPIDQLFLPQVTRLELTNYSLTMLPNGSQTIVLANLRTHFPSLEVLRWLGSDQDEPSSDTETDVDPLEGDTDAHQDLGAGIRIENQDGEKLELSQLLIW